MDRNKMKEMANRMKEANKRRDDAVAEVAVLVQEGTLTIDEAAKCVTGAMMKAADELGLSANAAQSDDLGYIKVLIDQACGDFDGLVIGRHI